MAQQERTRQRWARELRYVSEKVEKSKTNHKKKKQSEEKIKSFLAMYQHLARLENLIRQATFLHAFNLEEMRGANEKRLDVMAWLREERGQVQEGVDACIPTSLLPANCIESHIAHLLRHGGKKRHN